MNRWNSKQLANWILKYGKKNGKVHVYSKYARIVIEEEVSGRIFLNMDIDELKQLGFKKTHAKTLLNVARGFA